LQENTQVLGQVHELNVLLGILVLQETGYALNDLQDIIAMQLTLVELSVRVDIIL
jgi:hypothetical protein